MKKILIMIFILSNIFIYCEEYIKINIKSNIENIDIEINEYLNNDKTKIKKIKYEGDILEVKLIKSKPYRLTVNETGYEKFEYYFTADGQDISIILNKKRNKYTLKLTSNKKPAVYINNKKMGIIPMELELEEGIYNIRFVMNDEKPKNLYINVNKNETIFIKFMSDEEKYLKGNHE